MATNPEAIAQLIAEATAAGFRDDLLAKGQARVSIGAEPGTGIGVQWGATYLELGAGCPGSP